MYCKTTIRVFFCTEALFRFFFLFFWKKEYKNCCMYSAWHGVSCCRLARALSSYFDHRLPAACIAFSTCGILCPSLPPHHLLYSPFSSSSLFRTTNNLALAAPHVPYSTVSQPSYSFAGQTYSIYSIALFALDKGGSRVPNIATPLPMTTIGSGNGKGKQGNKKWLLASSDLPIG